MKIIIIVLLIVGGVILLWRLMANSDGGVVTLQDFPALVSALETTGAPGSFWVVLIPGTARDDGDSANLQYSIEDGVVGLDWVLLAKRNVEDQHRFAEMARLAGATTEEKKGKDVRYLRATGAPDLATLGQAILQGLYGVNAEDRFELIVSGFAWRQKSAASFSAPAK